MKQHQVGRRKISVNEVTLAYARSSTYLLSTNGSDMLFTKALYPNTSITPSLSSQKQIFLTPTCISVFLKYICICKNTNLSLLVYLSFFPFFPTPRAAGSKACGTHARTVTKADFDCRMVQIYIYVRNEAAAKSQLLHSKIVCKTYYCAPVKI